MKKLRPYQNDLVEDLRQSWRAGARAPCIVLPCGGGKSCIVAEIAKRTTDNGKRVMFLVHRRELVAQIRRTFVDWGVDLELCKIGMVQTYSRRLGKLPAPSLIITDENHHSPAATYKKIYDAFPNARRVGVTATPVRLNGDGLGDVNDKLIIGVSAKWLIENHFLAPYDYYAPGIADLTGLHTRRGEFVASEIESKMIKKAIFGDVIHYYKQLAGGKKAICYCATVKHSEKTAEAFRAAGIPAEHIDGKTPEKERDRIINDFRTGRIKIMCNVDLISEGFDVPDCECVILLRPTQSLTLYIQQSMRCMRYKAGKTAIIIDHVGNYARHGMPDDDREWTLAKKEHVKGVKRQENNVQVKQCPECFYTFNSDEQAHICPACGYVFPNKREVEETSGELLKIESFKLDYTSPDQCGSYSELLDYAKKRGWKPGWAYYQAKKRGYIH